jgi:hypothetical protein
MLQRCEMLSNRLLKERQTGVGNEPFLILPPLVVDQVILETAEADALATEDISRFQAVAEETIAEKLVTVREQVAVSRRIGGVEVAFAGLREEAERKGVKGILSERPSLAKRPLEERNDVHQGGVP